MLALHSLQHACCGPTPSSCLSLVSPALSSHLLASCLLLVVACVQQASWLLIHLWRARSVRFHPLLSAAILHRLFLRLYPTVTFIIPLQFTRCLTRHARHADPLLSWASLPAGVHSFALIIRITQAAELKLATFYVNLTLKSLGSTWPPIQFNLFKTFPYKFTDHVVLLRLSGSRTLNIGTATITVRPQLSHTFIPNKSSYLKNSLHNL